MWKIINETKKSNMKIKAHVVNTLSALQIISILLKLKYGCEVFENILSFLMTVQCIYNTKFIYIL